VSNAAPRDCQACFHVLGGKMDSGGQQITVERCKLHRAGPNPMTTWTVLQRVTLCGPERKNWKPKDPS